MGTTTLETFIQRIASTVGAGEEPVNFTSTSGDTTSIISTSANFRKTAATAYNGRVAVVTDTSDDAAPEGEAQVVTTFNGSNDLTTGTFSAAIGVDSITLLPAGLGLDDVQEAIDDVTRTLQVLRWLPLTLCPDGDMESTTSDAGTNWDDVGSTTLTKDTTAITTLLRTSLKIIGTGDGTGARSGKVSNTSIKVSEGEVIYVSVAIWLEAGTAEIELWDNGAAAVIADTQYTADDLGWQEVRFNYTVGTDVEEIDVQITQSGSTNMTAFVGWVSVASSRQRFYTLPTALKDASTIIDVEYLPKGARFENDSLHFFQEPLRSWLHPDIIKDFFAATTQRILITTPPHGDPMFVRFGVTDTVMTAMSSTVFLENDLFEAAVDGMISNTYKKLYAQQVKAGNDIMAAAYKREQVQHGKSYRGLLDRLNMARPAPTIAKQTRVRAGVRW